MKYPVVLIKSDGLESAESIITNIRKIPLDQDQEIVLIDQGVSAVAYKYHIVTKYYENDVLLYPFTQNDLSAVPDTLKNYIEAVLIYFDAADRKFLESLDKYASFVEDNEIELGILLCQELHDDEKAGITYREAKQHFKLLDVIELNRKHSDEDDDEQGTTSHHDPIGYEELLQALRSFLWSNVNTGAIGFGARTTGYKKHSTSSSTSPESGDNTSAGTLPANEKDVEAELASFEKLLAQLITFRPNSQNWSRNERLAHAQEFAEIFEDLIDEADAAGEDSDNPSDLSEPEDVKIVDANTGSAFSS